MDVGPLDIGDLRHRIRQARWPGSMPLDAAATGLPTSFVRELLQTWAEDYDFEGYRRRISALPHVRVLIDGTWTHAVHARSERLDALPVLVTHGWPSSFLEIVPLLRRLVDPPARTGPAFHVVIPSLPGFAWSDMVPACDQLTAAAIADRWRTLMWRLGYTSFLTSGADIGARVSGWLAVRHADAVLGAHMSTNALWPEPTSEGHHALSVAEARWLNAMADWARQEGAYHHLQATTPVTAALTLAGSPVAQASWVAEKWWRWSRLDLRRDPARRALLDLLTLYWTTDTLPASLFHYWAHDLPPGARPAPAVTGEMSAPVSIYANEGEIGGVPPRSLASRQFRNPRWVELPGAGHFMASEAPDVLARDIRAFARSLG